MKVSAIITAAGTGKRMRSKTPKQFLEIAGRPILLHTLEKFEASQRLDFITVVSEPARVAEIEKLIADSRVLSKEWIVVAGGKERQDSVNNGLKALPQDSDIVIVHDGVRPFISTDLIDDSIEIAVKEGGCIVAIEVNDTVKRGETTDTIVETVDRSGLWRAQTPQTFRYEILKRAFDQAYKENFYGTDEASLVERIGETVKLLRGSYKNIKITTPEDLEFAEAITKGSKMKMGIGYDIHRLVEKRKLILGGVEIPAEKGLLGHSDADVLLHAISDAILGAASLGDIGQHFPDTDPKFKDADSRKLLRAVAKLINKKGHKISNIDAIIIAERPKMMPHIEEMRRNIADDLKISFGDVSVKATTNEGIGGVGRGEAIAAQAIALLK